MWSATSSAREAVVTIQARNGATAAAMIVDDGPRHDVISPLISLSNRLAA
ncbi:Uncharacterised protein [Mycobacterium tuberculosis]|uniref:Uncharacterized protein n=1 Tax=Mycobacterium tuberculosis TaxID=1773 RepID=A0A916LA88_MYCTX|nr:Uncharacterised protein [Mycobacterium tuberculosis]COW77193.1 Uncharacterised protein [Mycobacterium tuberculosis]COX66855.1 Uncharacterised protein [Mycobacterium tuberculosis]